jgi:hypothetical protein
MPIGGNDRGSGTREWPRLAAPRGMPAGPKGVIARAFCRRMVHETGKDAPQVLAAWMQDRAEVRWFAGQSSIAVRIRLRILRESRRRPRVRENYKMIAGPGSRGKVRACEPPTTGSEYMKSADASTCNSKSRANRWYWDDFQAPVSGACLATVRHAPA